MMVRRCPRSLLEIVGFLVCWQVEKLIRSSQQAIIMPGGILADKQILASIHFSSCKCSYILDLEGFRNPSRSQ